MDAHALMEKYGRRAVPRYTSYPTVPHFQKAFPGRAYGDWLAALPPRAPISIYLHVPFCRKLCWYCGCNMKLATRYEPIAAYVDALLAEIDLIARALPEAMPVAHIHWGGGTPTALSPDDLARVMDRVRARFDVLSDAEIAIESDPRTLSDDMIERIGTLGFNRASFGVQEFSPEVQQAINRIQPPAMVQKSVDALRNAGVAAINFDLIYGLPHQTTQRITSTIAQCVGMAPDRVALFGYAHVPWMAKKQRMIDEAHLPGATARMAQASAAGDALTAAGYEAVGIDHFARPGDPLAQAARGHTLRRNFQGYTTDGAQTLIGLGATSIGRTPGGFIQNIAETGAWMRSVADGDLPVAKGLALSDDDRVRAHVIEEIMCLRAVDLAAAPAAALGSQRAAAFYSARGNWWDEAVADLEEMASDDLVEMDAGRLALTAQGRTFARVVACAFDAHHRQSQARHSVAV